jgi:(2Fe-2S) ferredoxin
MLDGMIPSSNRRNRIASGPRESRLMPNAASAGAFARCGCCIFALVCVNKKKDGDSAMKQTCFVCQNVDCQSRGSEKVMEEISKQVSERSIDAEVKPYICFGGCEYGPNVVVHPQKVWYAGVQTQDVPEIVDSLAGGPPVSRLDTIDPSLKEIVYSLLDSGVF